MVNFKESTTILSAHTKKVWKLIEGISYFLALAHEYDVTQAQFLVAFLPSLNSEISFSQIGRNNKVKGTSLPY